MNYYVLEKVMTNSANKVMNMNVNLVLEAGKVVRVTGPARIEVRKGRILLVGAIYDKGSKIIIHKLRSYAFKSLEDSEVAVFLGSGASLEEPNEGEEVIDSWIKISDDILKDSASLGKLLIIVIGPVESGKTTLSAFIANTLIRNNIKVGIIDADVGQEDIAIPTTVALAIPKDKFIWQRDLEPTEIRFVGCIAPQYCQESILFAVKDLVDSAYARGLGAVVVNTDGWLNTHAALLHKLTLIRWLRPTHVIVLDNDVYDYLIKSLPSNIRVINAPKPVKVRERNREERRGLRSEAYRKYFSKAKERSLDINNIKVIYSNLINGTALSSEDLAKILGISVDIIKDKVAFASKYLNSVNVVLSTPDRELIELLKCKKDLCITDSNDVKGLLVGILNKDMKDVAVGIVKDIDFGKGTLKILTPWDGEISALIVGRVKLSLDTFEDNTRVGRCVL